MPFKRATFVSGAGLLASLAAAQVGSSTLVSTAGSVAGLDKSVVGAQWQGLQESARSAEISYAPNNVFGGKEFKFASSGNGVAGKIFDGFDATNPAGTTITNGFSRVSNPGSSDAPVYYDVTWTSIARQTNSNPTPNLSGTYDPWAVRYADVSALGTPDFGTADLYYQTGLLASDSEETGFDLGAQQIGNYGLQSYIFENGAKRRLFGIDVDTDGTLTLRYTLPSDFRLVLLGANASDPFASPTDRLMASDAVPITSLGVLAQAVGGALNPDGSLNRDLSFGLLRQGYVLQPSADPNKTLFSWHTDSLTGVRAEAVPEPSSMAALAIALLALRRRRKASN